MAIKSNMSRRTSLLVASALLLLVLPTTVIGAISDDSASRFVDTHTQNSAASSVQDAYLELKKRIEPVTFVGAIKTQQIAVSTSTSIFSSSSTSLAKITTTTSTVDLPTFSHHHGPLESLQTPEEKVPATFLAKTTSITSSTQLLIITSLAASSISEVGSTTSTWTTNSAEPTEVSYEVKQSPVPSPIPTSTFSPTPSPSPVVKTPGLMAATASTSKSTESVPTPLACIILAGLGVADPACAEENKNQGAGSSVAPNVIVVSSSTYTISAGTQSGVSVVVIASKTYTISASIPTSKGTSSKSGGPTSVKTTTLLVDTSSGAVKSRNSTSKTTTETRKTTSTIVKTTSLTGKNNTTSTRSSSKLSSGTAKITSKITTSASSKSTLIIQGTTVGCAVGGWPIIVGVTMRGNSTLSSKKSSSTSSRKTSTSTSSKKSSFSTSSSSQELPTVTVTVTSTVAAEAAQTSAVNKSGSNSVRLSVRKEGEYQWTWLAVGLGIVMSLGWL